MNGNLQPDDPDGSAVVTATKIFGSVPQLDYPKAAGVAQKSTSLLRSLIPFTGEFQLLRRRSNWRFAKGVKSAPGCEDFVGAIIKPKTPKSLLDPNWKPRQSR
jgi:hypothetical protein